MDIRQLKTLLVLGETRSFSKAARQVGLTQSAITHQIKELEATIGRSLIDRRIRPVGFTACGMELLEVAERIVNLREGFLDRFASRPHRETLKIGVISSYLTNVLPRILRNIRFNGLSIRLIISNYKKVSEDLIRDVEKGDIDFAIVIGPPYDSPSVVWRHLVKEPMYVIAHPSTFGKSDVELLTEGAYIHASRHADNKGAIEVELRRRNIHPEVVVEVDSFAAVVEFVANGLGVGVCPESFLKRAAFNQLKAVPFGNPVISREIGIVQPPESPKIDLIDLLFNEIKAGTLVGPNALSP